MKRLILALLAALSVPLSAQQPADLPLLTLADLVYDGSARSPIDGMTAITYNAAKGSLYVACKVGQATGTAGHQVGEIELPGMVKGATVLTELETARILQPCRDPTEGKFMEALVPGTPLHIGGLLVTPGGLLVNEFAYYDANHLQKKSLFRRPLDLSVTGKVEGPLALTSAYETGFASGYLAPIPSLWAALLGGSTFIGQCCLTISPRTNNGPGGFAFNPIGPALTPLAAYPALHPMAGGAWNITSQVYNGTTLMAGCVIPEWSRSLLCIGTQGIGTYWYGNWDAPPAGVAPDVVRKPRGNHAPPYRSQVWAFDLNDLAAVRAGAKQPWDVRPDIWPLPALPFQGADHIIPGVTYDAQTQRLFVTSSGDGNRALIHALHVQAKTTPPPPPVPCPCEVK